MQGQSQPPRQSIAPHLVLSRHPLTLLHAGPDGQAAASEGTIRRDAPGSARDLADASAGSKPSGASPATQALADEAAAAAAAAREQAPGLSLQGMGAEPGQHDQQADGGASAVEAARPPEGPPASPAAPERRQAGGEQLPSAPGPQVQQSPNAGRGESAPGETLAREVSMMFGSSGAPPRPGTGSAQRLSDPSHEEDPLQPTESGMFLYAQQQQQQEEHQHQEQHHPGEDQQQGQDQQGLGQEQHQEQPHPGQEQQHQDQQGQGQQGQAQRQQQRPQQHSPVEPSSPFGAAAQQGTGFASQGHSPQDRRAAAQSRLGPQARAGVMF